MGAAKSDVTLVVDHATPVRTLADHSQADGVEKAAASPRAQISDVLLSDDNCTKKTDDDSKTKPDNDDTKTKPAPQEENPLEQIMQALSCGKDTGVETDR